MGPQKAALSSVSDYNYLTYATATHTITLAAAGSSTAVMDIQVWGW